MVFRRDWRGHRLAETNTGVLLRNRFISSFIILSPFPVLTLFTSCSHPVFISPGLRLQIRNRLPNSQEKIGTLFFVGAQNCLDAKRSFAGVSVSLGDEIFV